MPTESTREEQRRGALVSRDEISCIVESGGEDARNAYEFFKGHKKESGGA